MSKATVLTLFRPTRTQNSIGEWISVTEPVDVFAEVQSVSSSEFFAASQMGLAPEYRFTMFHGDYNGETILEHEGQRLSVYRTYHNGPDTIELYCQREAGTATVTTTEPETAAVAPSTPAETEEEHEDQGG